MTINIIIKTQKLPKNFTEINRNFYKVNLKDEVFFVRLITKNGKIIDIEPASLHSYLIDMSDKVLYGNNFESTAICLNNDNDFLYAARQLDKCLCAATLI